MKRVGVFGNKNHAELLSNVAALTATIQQNGCLVSVDEELGWKEAQQSRSAAEIAGSCDLAVVLGGDGSLLRVVRLLQGRRVPVFGVNLGYLGFLTAFTTDEAKQELRRVLDGDYSCEERITLSARLERQGQVLTETAVFNDVVVSTRDISRIGNIIVSIDGVYVTDYRADGLIVATPSGSTAYAMAAGGPIVMPGTLALTLAPICPHMLTMRPLVVPAESSICVQIEDSGPDMVVTFDGQQVEMFESTDNCTFRSRATRCCSSSLHETNFNCSGPN